VGVVGRRPPRLRPLSRSSSRRCTLANRLPPVVRAYLHVALPGSGREASSPALAGGHGHECCLLRADRDSTSSAQLVVAGGWDQAALAQSFSTVGLTSPVGPEWIADSGASYHTTPDAGILSSVRPPHPSCPSSIMVGDGSCLPVTSVGSALGPFRLSDVLVAPQMVHNLLSICQFTADNSCSVEFDSSGLYVKDLATGRPLLRCDNTRSLYNRVALHPSASWLRYLHFTFVFFVRCSCRDTVHHHLAAPTRSSWPRCFGSD
jgi:hypothetical protein